MQNGKYVLFEAQHVSGLFQFVFLKRAKFLNDDVILLINKKNFHDLEFAKNFVKENIFKKIVSFSEPFFKNTTDVKDILNFYDTLFTDNHIDIDLLSEIITCADVQNTMAIYFILKKKPITYMELHENQFEDDNRYNINTALGIGTKFIEELSKKYRVLTGDGEVYNRRLLFENSKKSLKNDESINFFSEFYNMDQEYKSKILKCFNIDYNKELHVDNLLLFNSMGWTYPMTKLPLPKYYIPFLLIADYYFPDDENVYIKDHPQNDLTVFNKNIKPYSLTIDSAMPIEFLGLLKNFHIKKLISVDSGSGSKIANFVDKEIKLGRNYLTRGYFCNHKLFCALKILSYLQVDFKKYIYNIDIDYFNLFVENSNLFSIPPIFCGMDINQRLNKSFNIIGYLPEKDHEKLENMLANSDDESIFIFLNFDELKLVSLKNISILDNVLPVTFLINKTRESSFLDNINTKFVIYTKNKEYIKKLFKFSLVKELKNSGAKVSLNIEKEFSVYPMKIQEMKINVLKNKIEQQDKEIYLLKNRDKN